MNFSEMSVHGNILCRPHSKELVYEHLSVRADVRFVSRFQSDPRFVRIVVASMRFESIVLGNTVENTHDLLTCHLLIFTHGRARRCKVVVKSCLSKAFFIKYPVDIRFCPCYDTTTKQISLLGTKQFNLSKESTQFFY